MEDYWQFAEEEVVGIASSWVGGAEVRWAGAGTGVAAAVVGVWAARGEVKGQQIKDQR